MPRLRELATQADRYRQVLRDRCLDGLITQFDDALSVYEQWRLCVARAGELRAESNRLSKEYARTKEAGLQERSKALKTDIGEAETQERDLTQRLKRLEVMLPNWLLDQVPIGEGDSNEQTVEFGGIPTVWTDHAEQFGRLYPGAPHQVADRRPFHHYDLVGKYVDQDKAGDVAQSRFYYEFDELVILDFALSMFAMEFFRGRGYDNRLMITPYVMRRDVEEQITYMEAFQDTIFTIKDEELLLIPSSEHPIVAYYKDTIFSPEQLPLRVMAWSPCFRKEAGAHGKDMRGIFRVKQFHKVELHSIVKEGEDQAEVDRIRVDVQGFMDALGLPWRSVIVPSADTDKRGLLQVDIQAWMPGQGQFRETHSIATVGTWISEKLGISYRTGGKTNELTRHVYGTAVAVQRTICAIVENCFNPETNAVVVPEALRKYTMGITDIPMDR